MTTPPKSTFPSSPEEFDADPRVSFSKLTDKFILETDDGQEYEFDDALRRWVPVVRPHSPIAKISFQEPQTVSVSCQDKSSCSKGKLLMRSHSLMMRC